MDIFFKIIFLVILSATFDINHGAHHINDEACPMRDGFFALHDVCKLSCYSDEDCQDNEQCLCDYKCGMSCLNETKDCLQPQHSHKGYVILPSPPINNFRQEVTFGCQEGTLYGPETLHCLYNGEWDGFIPQCYSDSDNITCGSPPTIPNAVGSSHGSLALYRYQCNEGYTFEGSNEIVCMPNGLWSPIRGHCLAPSCGTPGRSPHLKQIGLDYSVGSIVKYQCEEGFDLIGETERRCMENLIWNGSIPTCIGRSCPPLVGRPNLHMYPVVQNGNDSFVVHDVVTFSCTEGYALNGDSECRCLPNSVWSCPEVPSCEEIKCFAYTQERLIPSGVRYHEAPKVVFNYNETIHFYCEDADSTFLGASEKTCIDREMWVAQQPSCKESCSDLPTTPPNSVRMTEPNYLKHGGIAVYICDEKYRMTGTNRFVCNDGKWSGGIFPTCEFDENGFHDIQTKVSSNFAVVDETIIAFEGDENLEILCKVPQNKGPRWHRNFQTLHASVYKQRSVEGHSWHSVTFPRLQVSMSGNYSCVVYGYSGKYVNVSLHVYARCPDPGLVENGERSLSHDNMKAGSFAMYSCNSGYNIDGSSTIGCRADGTWSAPTPRCITDNCEKNLPLPFHGFIIERSYESPENMTGFLISSCRIGYINNTDNRMECQNSVWVGQAPACFKGSYDVVVADIANGGLLEHATLAVEERQTLHLSCWLENDLDVVTEFRKFPENEVVYGPQDGEMLISNVSVNDEGIYECLNLQGDVLQTLDIKVIRRCPDLKPLRRGFMTPQDDTAMGYYEGAVVNFSCDDGYSISGDHTCFCKDGSWVGVIPSCLPDIEVSIESDPLTSVNGVLFQYEGGEIMLTCTIESSYEIADLRDKYMLQWTFSGVVKTEEMFFQQGMFNDGLRLRLTKVTLDHTGFYMCGTSNTQSSIYVHVTKRCIDDHTLPNGLKALRDEPGDQSIDFTCDSLFNLIGSSHRECLPTGEWSGIRPSCTAFSCEPITEIPNGQIANPNPSFLIGAELNFTCDEDFQLIGWNESLTCLEGGIWSSSIPTCTHLCDLITCPFARKCEIVNSVATCVCRESSDCEDVSALSALERACGSNGKTYPSFCHLEVESCQNQDQNIDFVHDGTCVIGDGCSTVPIDKFTAMEEGIDMEFAKYFLKNSSCVLTPYNYGVPMGTGFLDKAECDRVCIHENFCLLPRNPGICSGQFQRWAYDAVRRICVQFEYSGCGGNQNNFRTKDQCTQTCPDRCPICKRKISLTESCCADNTIVLVKITHLNRFQTRTIFRMTVLNGTVPAAWESNRVKDVDNAYSVMSTSLLYRDDPCICPHLMVLDTPFLLILDTDNPQLEENTFAEPWTAKLQSEFLATKSCSGYISMLDFEFDRSDLCS